MLVRVLSATFVIALLLAGCVTPAADKLAASSVPSPGGPVVPPKPDFDFSKVIDPDHGDHLLPQLHTAGHGLDLQGLAPIQSILPMGARGSITQIDLWKNYALVSGMEGGLAFAIVDIKDPAKPKAISYFPSAADGWTARFSADGDYVYYGCQMLGATGYALTNLKGTCKDPEAVHAPNANPGGIIAVDVKDKAKPKFVDFLPTSASHNLFVASINGTDTIFTNGVNILQFDRSAGKLLEVATVPGVHDSTVHQHPITKDWLLFTGTKELTIYNVNDPKNPQVVFEGNGDRKQWTGWHEQTMIPGIVDGRVIMALAGETGVAATAGAPDIISFLDITDPAHPTKLSTWHPPFDPKVPWPSYYFSAHEMAATPTGQVAISWYHGGVWVVDVSTKERQAAPVTLAAYQPHDTITALPSTFAQTPVPVVPFVWGAGWDERGYLIVPDMHTGVYVLKPEWGLHATGSATGGQ